MNTIRVLVLGAALSATGANPADAGSCDSRGFRRHSYTGAAWAYGQPVAWPVYVAQPACPPRPACPPVVRHRRVWVPGYWAYKPTQCGRAVKHWIPGRYEVIRIRAPGYSFTYVGP